MNETNYDRLVLPMEDKNIYIGNFKSITQVYNKHAEGRMNGWMDADDSACHADKEHNYEAFCLLYMLLSLACSY